MRPKKIILIVIDSLRQDHLGCYGYKRNTSPNIDDLAKESFVFKHAFSPSSLTIPAIGSILTSKYPGNHSIGFDPKGKLDPNIDITLASILSKNNYKTAAFVSDKVLRKQTNFNAGFEIYDDEIGSEPYGRRDCQKTNQQVFKWVEENYLNDFFLFIHYFDAHGPYLNQEPYKNMFVEDEFYGPPEVLQEIFDQNPTLNSIPHYQILNPIKDENNDLVVYEKDLRYYKAQYDGCIRYIDDCIGKLTDKLKELGIYDDSLIIISSDHGEAFGENNVYLSHGLTVTLDQISVTLILKPNKDWNAKKGAVSIPVTTMDIMPTVLSLCNYDINKSGIDGFSLVRMLENKDEPILKKRTLVSENEVQFALIRPDGLLELKKKDTPASAYYSSIAALIDSLHGTKFYWDTGNEYTLNLPFDQYQRYKVISDIINKFRSNNNTFRILDVGASLEGNLKKFLPHDEIYFMDREYPVEYKQKSNYITGDVIKSHLPDNYDFVVSVDTYEHIDQGSREIFINKLLSHSTIATIIAAPFDTPGVREQEIFVNENYKISHGSEYRWLHEHIQNGLPSLPFTLELIKKSGLDYAVIPNGYLPRWFEMISIFLLTEGMPDFSNSMKELYELYNKNFYCYDNLDPAYRHVIIINKVHNNIDFSDNFAKNPESDEDFAITYQTLESFIKKIRELCGDFRYKELIEIRAELIKKRAELIEKKAELIEKSAQVTELSNALTDMQQSIVWRLLMKFNGFIEAIFPDGSERRRLYDLGLRSGRILINEGWRSLLWKFNDYRSSRKIDYSKKIELPILNIQTICSLDNLKTIEKKVSIVIPTKNAGHDFEFTLEKIKNQKGIIDIEIIIVDSGSNDDTIKLAEKYGSKVYIIKPEEFNHGATRNFGAEKAAGDYVLFLVQDAIPIGEYWLYNMVKVLESDDKIAAASCRQVPRSDAELFTCSLLWNHSRMLGLNADRLSSLSQNFNNLSILEKRKMAGLEDVCCLLRKEIFDHLKFKNIQYAEDLELGIRILENKYKIAFLFSVGVIHSHNRTPIYFLKRSYVDNKILPAILSYEPDYFTRNYNDIYEVISDIMISYMVLNASIESLKSISFNNNATEVISKFKSFIQVNSKKDYSELKKFELGNTSLDDFFEEQKKMMTLINTVSKDLLITNFFYLVEDFRLYTKLYPSINYKQKEFIVDLYQLFSLAAGSMLANYYLFKSRKNEIDEKLSGIDSELSRGI